MTISQAIEELEQVSKKTDNKYVVTRLQCIIEDLSDYVKVYGEEQIINEAIAKPIENRGSSLAKVDRSWVNNLYFLILNFFRAKSCEEYYKDNRKSKGIKIIDGETISKWITIISALVGVLFGVVAIALNGFQITGMDFDKLGFIITFSGGLIAISIFIITAIINAVLKSKFKKHCDEYTFEELLSAKYDGKPKRLWFQSHTAAKISKGQITIGDNNRQSQRNKAKAKNGANVYQNAGDVIESISTTNSADEIYKVKHNGNKNV